MRTHLPRSLVLFALAPLALARALPACSSDPETAPPIDAGAPEPEAGLVCDPVGITKGPWVQAINGSSATIHWEACKEGAEGRVKVTPEAGGASQEFTSSAAPFEVIETFQAPLNPAAPPDWAGTYYMHAAALMGLSPGTCYRYELVADASRSGRFCTARPPSDPLRFMVIGDTNPALGDHPQKLFKHALPMNPDFVIHGGDIQYYSSTIETWAYWFGAMQPMLSQGGFFPALGNHEAELPGELDQYTRRFFGEAGFDGTTDYYLFESGGVWFFSIDTEQDLSLGSLQGTWLSSKLEAASKSPGFRFSVVFFHKPLVTCGPTGDNPSARAELEPLFLQYKVPLVLQAHMHGYERFDFNGVTYVTSAGGGGKLENVDENIERAYCAMRVASGAFFHALMVDVTATEIKGSAIGEDGSAKDTFSIPIP